MATSSYTAEFGAGVVVNGLDLNTDATKVLVGGRKGITFVFVFVILSIEVVFCSVSVTTILLMLLLL